MATKMATDFSRQNQSPFSIKPTYFPHSTHSPPSFLKSPPSFHSYTSIFQTLKMSSTTAAIRPRLRPTPRLRHVHRLLHHRTHPGVHELSSLHRLPPSHPPANAWPSIFDVV
ncbi:hypothetical protein RND81_09G187500 [Saponaria officinalis]|uniref:Uncharacterized protein n=1 Tax=Saponaria officinalis TaxID=3572 RepID=A0AAW1IPG9_SAPOF